MAALDFTHRLRRRVRRGNWPLLAATVWARLLPARPSLRPAVLKATDGRTGLEIGGPSRVFSPGGIVPIYRTAARIDNVNFAAATRWESALRDGGEFRFHPQRPPGTQWLREAGRLEGLRSGSYDFALSSHCLEHVANPLDALREWHRVVRPGGHLIVVLPDPRRTFDHRRPLTSLAHLRADFARQTGEDDLTHRDEALALHDISRDPGVSSLEEFRDRLADNPENRCLHHHVFNLELLTAALAEAGWTVQAGESVRPIHLVAFAQKLPA